MYSIAYNDDGNIHLLLFNKYEVLDDFDVNKFF